MAGNRAIYTRAMEQSREAARQKQWDDALKQAALAMQEFPNDSDARVAVAVSLFHTGKLDQALKLLRELRTADPNNPFYLEYIARAQERQGNNAQAIDSYRELLDTYQGQRSTNQNVQSLRELLRLAPNLDDYRLQLADLLIANRANQDAATEYLYLARRYQQQNQLDRAAEYADRVVQLVPESREAKELLMALRSDMASAAGFELPQTDPTETQSSTGGLRAGSSPLTGIRSQQFVLEKLVSEAMEKQETGDIDGAIQTYEEVLANGLERADVFYSLGLLHQERGDHATAVQLIERASGDPEYALSAHYALGLSYTELGQLQQAAQEYEQAIGMVDLATVGRTESEDLIQMYEEVTRIYQQIGDVARAASLYSTLANFLQSRRWGRERAEEFKKRAKELTDMNMMAKLRQLGGTGSLTGMTGAMPEETLLDIMEEPDEPVEETPERWGKIPSIMDYLRSDGDISSELLLGGEGTSNPLEVLESLPPVDLVSDIPVAVLSTTGLPEKAATWVTASGRYTEQGLLDAAMDACYEVMKAAPDYLMIHLRMGEVLERNRMVEEAVYKYQTLIDALVIRGDQEKAIDVYYRLVELVPDTINARSRLADLLQSVGKSDEAALQLGHVADHYFRMGQTNRALEEYRRGLNWVPNNKELRAHYGFALFRLDRFEAALGEFHRVADPNDPVSIAHINMALAAIGEQPTAIWDSLAALVELLENADTQVVNTIQAEYRMALLSFDDPLLHYMLAVIQQRVKQHSSALLELEQAQELVKVDPHPLLPDVLLYQAMAMSCLELEQPEQALDHLKRSKQAARRIKDEPLSKHSFARPLSEGELVWQIAEAYALGGDLPHAEQALRDALRLMPSNQMIYTKLADVCFSQGKLDEAIATLNGLATYHENRQDLDQSIQVLEYAIKLAPNHIDSNSRLAQLYIRRGYPDKGIDALTRSAELQRKDGRLRDAVATLQQAGEIRWMQGQHAETLAIYDRIVQIAPNDVEARQWRAIMFTLAARPKEAVAEKKEIVRILTQRNDWDNAIAELHQIIGLDQQDLDAYYMLGDMLMRRSEYAQAVSLYTRMSRMNGVETERVEALLAAANRMLQQNQQQVPS